MTLYKVIEKLNEIALRHPNIRTAKEGNIYEALNANPSIKYGVFFITQGTHSEDENFDHYNFTLFFVDRLEGDMDSNRLQIQSIGKELLSNIIRVFEMETDCGYDNVTYVTFTQRFVDECAGAYAQITFDIVKDNYCLEEY